LETTPPNPRLPDYPILTPNTHGADAESRERVRKQSVIREHLRAWSVQNHKAKEERADSEFASHGRLTTLPSSLFIEETRVTEGSEIDEELDEYEDTIAGPHVKGLVPGDVIYVQPRGVKGRDQLAVYLGNNGDQHKLLLSDGTWVVEELPPVFGPTLRNFASAEEIEPLQKYLPVKRVETQADSMSISTTRSFAGEVPHTDAGPLLRRLTDLDDQMVAYRRDNLKLLDELYVRISHPENYTSLSFKEVVRKLLGVDEAEISDAARLIVFLELRKTSTVIQPVMSKQATSPSFVITPGRLAERFEKVCEWARGYQESAAQASLGRDVTAKLDGNPLTSFIEKARRLILKSRTLRSPTTTGSLGPSSVQSIVDDKIAVKDTGEIFSEEDKMILEFLWDTYIRTPVPLIRSRYHSIGSLILRAIGAYPKLRLERKIGSLLLQELGLLPPWTDGLDQNVRLAIPGRKGAGELNALCAESEALCKELGLEENPSHSLLEDSMASLRQDLGDMVVFCVDSSSTVVKDDAYSVEANDAIPGTHWLHVHIAHPSAFIDPDHVFAKRARYTGTNYYTPTWNYSMMPWSFAKAMSIDANSPTMTISTLLTEDGEVQDIQVRPTIVRNVVSLEPTAVNEVLGKRVPKTSYLTVGKGAVAVSPPAPETSPEAVAEARRYLPTLQKIDQLLKARSKARRRALPEFNDMPNKYSELRTKVDYLEGHDPEMTFRSQHYLGDPKISCVVNYTLTPGRASELEELESPTTLAMMLAAESAAKWFADRNMPALFQGSSTQPGFPLSKLNTMSKADFRLPPVGRNTSSPIPHVNLDMAGYLRITSPIRRYSDLVAMWQLDAYLRAEASGLLQPAEDASKINLPFTRNMLDEYLVDEEQTRQMSVLVNRSTAPRWALRALFRAFHFKEAVLPDVWDLRVDMRISQAKLTEAEDTGLVGRLCPFELPAMVWKSAEAWESSAARGTYLPVKIDLVDMARMRVICRAVGPASDVPNYPDPVMIAPAARVEP
jgi:hypothetical protein